MTKSIILYIALYETWYQHQIIVLINTISTLTIADCLTLDCNVFVRPKLIVTLFQYPSLLHIVMFLAKQTLLHHVFLACVFPLYQLSSKSTLVNWWPLKSETNMNGETTTLNAVQICLPPFSTNHPLYWFRRLYIYICVSNKHGITNTAIKAHVAMEAMTESTCPVRSTAHLLDSSIRHRWLGERRCTRQWRYKVATLFYYFRESRRQGNFPFI